MRVAQLDRATGYGPVGRGFESCHAHIKDNPYGLSFFALLNKNSAHGGAKSKKTIKVAEM